MFRVQQFAQSCVRQVSDFLCPPHCITCHAEIPRTSEFRTHFCAECLNSIAPPMQNQCCRCGAEVGPFVAVSDGCVHCRRKPIRFDSSTCLGMYNDAMRQAVLSSKWSWSSVTLEALSEQFMQRCSAHLSSLAPDLVIPIPQNAWSRLTRHFNPAEVIASVISRYLKIPADNHVIRRRRKTRPQKRISVQERYQNQRDSFRLRESGLIRGKSVLLVDDVLTTGATCSEAARLLKQHGATACHVAVIARVLEKR